MIIFKQGLVSAMKLPALIYLSRGHGAGLDAARRFFESYDRFPAGMEHELVVLVKGWDNVPGLDEVLAMAKARSARVIELPDDGFDFGAYFRAARKLPHEWCCFLNSFSSIQHGGWLKILFQAASRPGVGAVSCSGNWGTATNFLWKDFCGFILYARLKTAAHLARRAIDVAVRFWPVIPAFPNPHIRTNAFIVRRSVWLEFAHSAKTPADKRDCYILEHGRKSFTRFLRNKGLRALVAGADGNVFEAGKWIESGTFSVPGLPNLLVGDNQTEDYLLAPRDKRRQIEHSLWGKMLTPPSPQEAREQSSALRQWKGVPARIVSELRGRARNYAGRAARRLLPSVVHGSPEYQALVENNNNLQQALLENSNQLQALVEKINLLQTLLSHSPGRMFTIDASPLRFTPWEPFTDAAGNRIYLPPRELIPPLFAPVQVRIADAAPYDVPHVNLVLPSTSARHNSGGPNTAYTLAAELVKKKFPVRILAVTMPADDDSAGIRKHIARIGGLTPAQAGAITFLDASGRDRPVCLGANDIFIATAWWTAQMIKYILPLFAVKKFIYLIQDFEPLIHNASTNYALALETYSFDMLPVFNSGLLRDYFIQERVGRFADKPFAAESLCFEPAVDRSIFFPLPEKPRARKKRLLFYARPEAQRNLLEVGIGALMKILAEGRCNPEEWEFLSTDTGIGGQCRPVVLSDTPEVMLTPLPVHDLARWAEEMRHVDIMLSLILSPHTSYPPLEAAACGSLVVTNTWSVKTEERLRGISPNIIAGTPDIEGVAAALSKAMALCDEGYMADAAGSGLLSFPNSWGESWNPVLPGITAFLCANGVHPQRSRN